MTAPESTPRGRGRPRTHGITRLKEAVNTLGSRLIDRRTGVGRALAQWKADLVSDLGGKDAITTQQAAVIDLAVKTKLILDSIDAWLLVQPSLINLRKRALLPVVRERQQLADALARYMSVLGLERRAKPTTTLTGYIESRYGSQSGQHEPDDERGTDPLAAPAFVDPAATTARTEPARSSRMPLPCDPQSPATEARTP